MSVSKRASRRARRLARARREARIFKTFKAAGPHGLFQRMSAGYIAVISTPDGESFYDELLRKSAPTDAPLRRGEVGRFLGFKILDEVKV